MTGLVLALGALLVAAIEVIALGALLLAVTAVVYAAAAGMRSRPSSSAPERLGAVGVPRRLGLARESTLGGRLTFDQAVAFDGHAIGERLDRDVPGCDR